MAQKVTPGRIVLYRRAYDNYAPALVTKINEDGTVNLTVFLPTGTTQGVLNVPEGDESENWAWPGIDAGKENLSGKKEEESPSKATQGQGQGTSVLTDLGRHGATGPDDKLNIVPSEEAKKK